MNLKASNLGMIDLKMKIGTPSEVREALPQITPYYHINPHSYPTPSGLGLIEGG